LSWPHKVSAAGTNPKSPLPDSTICPTIQKYLQDAKPVLLLQQTESWDNTSWSVRPVTVRGRIHWDGLLMESDFELQMVTAWKLLRKRGSHEPLGLYYLDGLLLLL
jgi:hypothetical protein